MPLHTPEKEDVSEEAARQFEELAKERPGKVRGYLFLLLLNSL
jgi:hypothetical protein